MSKPITSVLRDCHRLRRHLRDLKGEIDLGPRVEKAHLAVRAKEEAAHKDAGEALKKAKLKLKDDEGALKTIEVQLGKLQSRSLEVTTMREMEATKSEIAQATNKKNGLEEAILGTMAEIEQRTANVPKADEKWADAQSEYARLLAEGKGRIQRLQDEEKATQAELTKVEATIPATVRPVYNSLVKSHGAEGIAMVKDKVCQSCRTTLTHQKIIELNGGAFLTCSSCGRALYPEE